MPSAIRYVPPTDAERGTFTGEVEQERRSRRTRYQLALEYYLGEHPSQIDYNPDEDEHDDNTVINLVQMTADRTVSFLFPQMPVIETDPSSIEDTEEEVWLKKFFESNGGLQALVKLGLRGFLSGHAFVRIKPQPANKRGRKNFYPIMTVLDPTSVTVYWRSDDVADVLWYEMRYLVGETVYIQDFVNEPDRERWLIYTYKSVSPLDNNSPFPGTATNHGSSSVIALDQLQFVDNGVFEQVGAPLIHGSNVPPIIEFAHLPHPDDYYGMGEFTQQTLQDTINRIVSLRNRLVSENADPVDVIIGADPEDVEKHQGMVTIVSPGAKVQRLELKGDLAGISGTLDKLIETYLAVARVVLLKGEAKDLQRVTNASVRTLFLDALSKNELLQSAYGLGLKKIAQLALSMGFAAGQISVSPEDVDITIHFPTPLPVDDTEIANQNAIMLNAKAMSKRTAANRMGLDWKFELAAQISEAELENEQALAAGEVAAQNAATMAAAVPPAPVVDKGKPPNA